MLVLRSLHNYLAQVLSPPYIHTALLLTPEGALVSYASRLENESDVVSTSSLGTTPVARTVGLSPDALPSGSPKSTESNKGTNGSAFEPGSAESLPRPRTVQPTSLSHDHVVPGIKMRSKDEVRIVAGLSSECLLPDARVPTGAQVGCVSGAGGEQASRADAARILTHELCERTSRRGKESDAECGDVAREDDTVTLTPVDVSVDGKEWDGDKSTT
ncbi:hypothetical protein ID866_2855 [Astraeus odoratus]|nr:hypothetical protein ID866_2855 [Astraeus odoratus]